jgi:hypothetical protein
MATALFWQNKSAAAFVDEQSRRTTEQRQRTGTTSPAIQRHCQETSTKLLSQFLRQ